MFSLGPMEIGVIVFVVVLLFGGKKIPQLARGITNSVKELRRGLVD